MQSRTTFTVWAATVALGLSTMVSSAALLGEYTFNNRTTLTTALGATSVDGGLEIPESCLFVAGDQHCVAHDSSKNLRAW